MVNSAVEAVMTDEDIPGMSVAVLVNGQRHTFHYGLASRETKTKVNNTTIFEIGSLSKPFTGVLAARLQAEGLVDLSTKAENIMPGLRGSPVGSASLLELATYNAGGLPLQLPEGVDRTNFVTWYRDFKPVVQIGTNRLYSNASIGLFGHLTAEAAGGSFAELLDKKVLSPLHLDDTFLDVPQARLQDYAQGYNRDNAPTRVSPGLFDEEAYGVKTTADDLLSFVEASMKPVDDADTLNEGLASARSGMYRVDEMYQGLGWELYGAPARLDALLQGAEPDFVLKPNAIEKVEAPVVDRDHVGTVSCFLPSAARP